MEGEIEREEERGSNNERLVASESQHFATSVVISVVFLGKWIFMVLSPYSP